MCRVCVQSLTCVQLFVTPWTVAHQAPLFMGVFRQEHWSRLPCPTAGDPTGPSIEPTSFSLFFFLDFFLNLFVVNFVIHWNETAMGLHVFPIPIPPPTSLSTRSP